MYVCYSDQDRLLFCVEEHGELAEKQLQPHVRLVRAHIARALRLLVSHLALGRRERHSRPTAALSSPQHAHYIIHLYMRSARAQSYYQGAQSIRRAE